MALRIGTSGWNYPSGKGSWNGIFYPLPEDRERGFDELRFYAERFNTVEVNSTFYGQPRANAALGWAKRTPQDFEFAVKIYQKFTHPGMAIDPGPVTQADVDAFKGGIDPLAAAGKLGPLLVQFPFSFQRKDEAVDYLRWLLRAFSEYQLAIELRHRSWSDAAAETRALLNEHRASLGADRRAEVRVVHSTGLCRPVSPAFITFACTAAMRRSGGTTPSRRIAITTSIPRRSWRRSPTRRAGRAS